MKSSNCLAAEEIIRSLITLAPHTEIANHTPGKVRLKLFLSGLKIIKDIDINALTQCIPGLLDMRVKTLSRSVEISYDPHQLPSDLWEDLDQIKKQPQSVAKVTQRLQTWLEGEKTV